jgi:pilus assembly protein CpaB
MRNRRAILFLLLSIVSGLSAVIAYYGSVRDAQQPVAQFQIQTVRVVMAKENLPAGVAVQPAQLQVMEWPSEYAPLGGIQVIEEVVHRIPRREITIGEPVLEQLLLEEGRQSGLTALIEANHRAMSVKADAVVGVGGFIQPGSRVDVVAHLKNVDRDKGRQPYARTILQNVKVLAIDENFERSEGAEPALASVVTLEVDPTEAQLLSYASAEGTLRLALRSEVDDNLVKLKNVGPKDFMDELPPPKRKKVARAPQRKSIESIRGTDLSREYL